MKAVTLLFPHQLFKDNPAVDKERSVVLVEEFLFFNQFNFHKQKLFHHRASMQCYKAQLLSNHYQVEYIEAHEEHADVRKLIPYLKEKGISEIHYVDVTDNWLLKRMSNAVKKAGITLVEYATPMFLNTKEDLELYFMNKKRYFQADFYTVQRKRLKILLDENEQPEGGKWSFDTENRVKYPRKKVPPPIRFPEEDAFYTEAVKYTDAHYKDNYGRIPENTRFPVSSAQSEKWLDQFLENRFEEFGKYEDAMVTTEHFLHHGVLTPMLNTGLLTPRYVVKKTLKFAADRNVPLNSVEGFIRQIIGWREFMRGVYEVKGTAERTRNYWGFTRKIPEAFWNGTTGIEPVDVVIKKVLEIGYCHHIERLMVLGNFMLLCEFDPDEVYKWFMELFIDSYDWVMVPNVYGMSQFADGGLMATKPYISSSNYLMKMSDFQKGEWQQIWDGLFWRFMDKQRKFFGQNPRIGMLLNTFDNMPEEKQQVHLKYANTFLKKLDSGFAL
ncbi:cryptochrome/photolyase family protein [Dyadobacter sediminis]|uniref:Cryptochrome/photolyase family protein n=1 Tax=Dyadobacter sediminis TaxID=1493691 RepID=A0A5R9K5K4_9BACT|nr:cryptochrome/photolyase family protein [Dyadobacter sediminis]TLU88834.1 cryptochrome/photolyase family protein [Dyadobacter sediminis]GGC13547.1 cryptochrome/photolyase family protein [Dyadobacter sediminis]